MYQKSVSQLTSSLLLSRVRIKPYPLEILSYRPPFTSKIFPYYLPGYLPYPTLPHLSTHPSSIRNQQVAIEACLYKTTQYHELKLTSTVLNPPPPPNLHRKRNVPRIRKFDFFS